MENEPDFRSRVKGESILLADEPELFADSVVKLLPDKELHRKISTSGKLFIEKNYSWNLVPDTL